MCVIGLYKHSVINFVICFRIEYPVALSTEAGINEPKATLSTLTCAGRQSLTNFQNTNPWIRYWDFE
nr:hypothetical transcript [Hymenolepis microstoma]